MSYTIENLNFDDDLNFGINTTDTLSNSPGKILTIVDENGRGIILPKGATDEKEPNYYLPFQNKYLGSFSYSINRYDNSDDNFDIYGKNGCTPFTITDYEPSYELDVNGAIDCQELYINDTLLNPAETHNLTSVTITNSNSYNINVSKI